MKNIFKTIKNGFKRKQKKIDSEDFLKKIDDVSSEYVKIMMKESHLMYSDESKLPYSKNLISDSLKIFLAYYHFRNETKIFNTYKALYNSLTKFQNISTEDLEKMKIFNNTNLIQKENELIQNKLKKNSNKINNEVKEIILAQAQRITKYDNKTFDYYTKICNKEYKRNNREFKRFILESERYLKFMGLNKSYFANFNNLFKYLYQNKKSFVKTLYKSI